MAGILGKRSDLMNDIQIQHITLEPRLAGLVQQGQREAELLVVLGTRDRAKL